ncbi:hypothetical protein ACROYT_G013208 [Oculina patagonica]
MSQILTATLSGKPGKAVQAKVKSAVVPSVRKVQERHHIGTGIPGRSDKDIEDSVKVKEELPEPQIPETETQDYSKVKKQDKKSSSGSSTSACLRPFSSRAERKGFDTKVLGKANGNRVHADVLTEDRMLDRWEKNVAAAADDDDDDDDDYDEVVPSGQQINKSSHKRTWEYLHQVTTALDNRRREEKDSLEPAMRQLETQTQSFQAMTERLLSNIMADFEVMLQKQLSSFIKGLHEEMSWLLSEVLPSVQDSVQKEIGLGLKGLRQQLSEMIASSAEATSPQAPDIAHTQVIVSRLVESGQFGQAFEEALSTADLTLVMYVCEHVDAETIFCQSPCPLSQPVLLCLIQQLSVDLTINTELKHKYIQEALVALDLRDEATIEYMPGVLEGLCQQLQSAIREASGPMQRSLKILQMAAVSISQEVSISKSKIRA